MPLIFCIRMQKGEELLEWRRKLLHLSAGVVLAVLVYHRLIDGFLLMGISFLLLTFFLFLRQFPKRFSWGYTLIGLFEREKFLRDFPGKSAFFFFFGIALTTLLFPRTIATAAILVLAIGDALSCLIGHHFGRIKTPFHPKKHVEGSLIGILCSTLALMLFLPFWPALFGSTIGMIFEFPKWQIGKWQIDDNIIVPLSTGVALIGWEVFVL